MSTPNWHWKQKDVSNSAKQFLQEKLIQCGTSELKVTQVKPEGDFTVGMRKGKVITIYDFNVVCTWRGTGEAAPEGELTCLEIQHDMDEDDYQFEVSSASSDANISKLKDAARKALADQMRSIFQQLPKEMVKAHASDLLVASGGSTPAAAAQAKSTSSGPATGVTSSQSSTDAQSLNQTSVRVQSSFMISAADLFALLTDESKVPTWTRNPAQIKAEVGSEVLLFGGNIKGTVKAVEKPTKFVMSWRAPAWPEGHYGTLTTTLDQGSADTKLSLKLDGVPLGKEEETERNLDIYYIRSLKQIGLGTIL